MIPDGSQCFLDHFWNFQNVHQIWTRAPCIYGFYYNKILQKILESIWGYPEKSYFYIYGLQKNDNFGKDGHRKMMMIRRIKSSKSCI